MKEISKPSTKQYYFIKTPEGVIFKEGVVTSKDVLSVPDSLELVYSDKRLDIIPAMEEVLGEQLALNDLLTIDEEAGAVWGRGNFNLDQTFFVFAAPSVAEPLSRALYKVVNPDGEGLYARVYDAPEGLEYSILEFRINDVVPIALGADPTPLADALAITVEDGALTQEEVDTIVDAISAYAGQEIKLADFIPASWQDKRTTKEGAIELGYSV
jgi:hypothetical protein